MIIVQMEAGFVIMYDKYRSLIKLVFRVLINFGSL